jgi:hypothetical protein
MTRARGNGSLTLIAASIGLAIFTVAGASEAETVAPVFQQSLPNIAGKTFTVINVDFAPGTRPRHTATGRPSSMPMCFRAPSAANLKGSRLKPSRLGRAGPRRQAPIMS